MECRNFQMFNPLNENIMKANNSVVWFEIYVEDLKRARTFYERVLDIKLNEMATPGSDNEGMEMLAFPSEMDGPGAAGALVKMDGFEAGGNSTIVYFGSEDCAKEESRIKQAGGKVFQSKQSIGEHGFIILATDTEGNMFGVHSQA